MWCSSSTFQVFPPSRGFLSAPDERVGLDLVEGPTVRKAVGIRTPENDAIALQSPLRIDEIIELRAHKNHAPLLESGIEEANRRADGAILLAVRRVSDPDVPQLATAGRTAAASRGGFPA